MGERIHVRYLESAVKSKNKIHEETSSRLATGNKAHCANIKLTKFKIIS